MARNHGRHRPQESRARHHSPRPRHQHPDELRPRLRRPGNCGLRNQLLLLLHGIDLNPCSYHLVAFIGDLASRSIRAFRLKQLVNSQSNDGRCFADNHDFESLPWQVIVNGRQYVVIEAVCLKGSFAASGKITVWILFANSAALSFSLARSSFWSALFCILATSFRSTWESCPATSFTAGNTQRSIFLLLPACSSASRSPCSSGLSLTSAVNGS